jgi:hypothetical protein
VSVSVSECKGGVSSNVETPRPWAAYARILRCVAYVVFNGYILRPLVFGHGARELRAPLDGIAATYRDGHAESALRGRGVFVGGERIWRNVSQFEQSKLRG